MVKHEQIAPPTPIVTKNPRQTGNWWAVNELFFSKDALGHELSVGQSQLHEFLFDKYGNGSPFFGNSEVYIVLKKIEYKT